MATLLRDLRVAVRVLLASKSWTLVVLLSLALGIGANTALFTAVNGLLLQTVAVREPEQLVRFNWTGKNDMVRSSSDYGYSGGTPTRNVRSTFSAAILEQFRAANTTLTGLAAGAPMADVNVILDGTAQLASSYQASGNYFVVLGVPASIGRVFGEGDDRPGAAPVAVISHAYWRKRFAGQPSVIGRAVSINGQMVTIVGVTPPAFAGIQRLGAEPPDITVPLAFDTVFNPPQPNLDGRIQPARMTQPTNWWLQMVGRSKPGISLDQVRANFATVFQHTAKAGMAEYQASLSAEEKALSTNKPRGESLPELLVKPAGHGYYDLDPQAQRSAGFLAVVVAIVLLIVCANVANLLLSRATGRAREIAVRLSMGATRGRLIRQLLTESLLLAGLGGALGVVVGYWARMLLPFGDKAPLDWRVFGFVAGVSMLTGIVFGLAPALRATRIDLSGAMKEGGRSVVGTRSRLAKGLVVVQVALSLVLVVGAGLFLRTLDNLKRVDVGFDSTNLLMFSIDAGVARYDGERAAQFFRQAVERLSAVPGVRSAAVTRTALLSGSMSTTSMFKQGQTSSTAAEGGMYFMEVSPTFFATMGIPVQRGRGFTDRDDLKAPKVVILNEAAARKLFPAGDAVGGRIGNSFEKSGELEIVGVVRDTKYSSLRDPGPPTMYRPTWQGTSRRSHVVLRTAGDPLALTPAVRAALQEIAPTLPVKEFTSQTDQIAKRVEQERLFALAYTAFGGLALLLACIGLFGLMSYNVARRTTEIGVRMALGAQRRTVVGMVLRESMWLVAIGTALGVAAALWAGRFVETVLFGLSPRDPFTIAAAIGVIAVVAAVAGYLPARRASRVDPMHALRQQ
jgi:predicted permease